jgi:2-polyprenyl-3-methyl-5-hydroxy-6-metoxy-1,4-benzoquinol methylase
MTKLDFIEKYFFEKAKFMMPAFQRQSKRFGNKWKEDFLYVLDNFFENNNHLEDAINAYNHFCFDGMRLQKRFEKTLKYEKNSYEESKKNVYLNKDYMFNVYLPGILLTHFLWPHHYENFLFFREKVISRVPDDKINFCDIGPGTGFYTRLILENKKKAQGHVFDISDHSIKFTKSHCKKFNVLDRLVCNKLNIINSSIEKKYDFLINVEVLEHMEDPIVFLKALQKMMKNNSYGFITAAVNAALEDHIYLYRSGNEVKEQIENCGFTVIEQQYDIAYEPKKNEPVPESVAFLVQKKP